MLFNRRALEITNYLDIALSIAYPRNSDGDTTLHYVLLASETHLRQPGAKTYQLFFCEQRILYFVNKLEIRLPLERYGDSVIDILAKPLTLQFNGFHSINPFIYL